MSSTRPFVFGVDLTYKSRGALAFAGWLRATLTPEDVEAVHVVPRVKDGPATLTRVHTALGEQLGAAADSFARVQVREASGIVEGLGEVESFARALVIGRRARSGERALVHLGPVARKLLRGLPLPTIVVPPELDAAALAGPVVLATDLEAHSERAARFAEQFARDCGRPLVVVYVAEVHYNEFVEPTDAGWIDMLGKYQREAAAELDRWVDAHGLAADRRVALCGSSVELLLELAEREQASLLVLGSRRLSTAGRVFSFSTASTLAAYAACPVAVVPPAT